jgi:hypothetical protein
MFYRTSIIVVLQLVSIALFAQGNGADARLEIARTFFNDVKSAILTNDQIIEKYLIEGKYFTDDSVKQVADEVLNGMRLSFQKPKSDGVRILKYSAHENEFAVTDAKPLNAPSIPMKLKFSLLYKQKEKSRAVDINDVYAVTMHYLIERQSPDGPVYIKQNTQAFLLFDDRNKLISIFSYMIGNDVAFLTF